MSVETIVPWRGGCLHRARALSWVLARYATRHPDWTITVAEAPEGPWVKALAVMPAIQASSAEVVVVADADAFCDGLERAVAEVEDGAPWAMPHTPVHRLSEQGTAAVLSGEAPEGQELAERVTPIGYWGGGIVVAHRSVLLDCPMDPRFVGWGQEDVSLAIALHHAVAPGWRGTATLWHLWHPPQPRLTRKRGSDAGWALYRRYCAARSDPAQMRQLLEDARAALNAAQPPRHGHPPVGVGHD